MTPARWTRSWSKRPAEDRRGRRLQRPSPAGDAVLRPVRVQLPRGRDDRSGARRADLPLGAAVVAVRARTRPEPVHLSRRVGAVRRRRLVDHDGPGDQPARRSGDLGPWTDHRLEPALRNRSSPIGVGGVPTLPRAHRPPVAIGARGALFGFSSYQLAEGLAHLQLTMSLCVPLAGWVIVRYANGRLTGKRFATRIAAIAVAQFLISPELLATMLLSARSRRLGRSLWRRTPVLRCAGRSSGR